MSGVPLEPDYETRQHLGLAALDYINGFIQRRGEIPVTMPTTESRLIEELLRHPREEGEDFETLLTLLDRAVHTGFDTASGGFLSYIPSGALYSAALGTLLGSATNQYTGAAHASPGAVAIEQSVIAWMAELFGLPSTSAGLLLSGGSIANLIAIVTARSAIGEDFSAGVVYASDRAHHSVAKAARVAGIASRHVRLIPTDSELRLDASALASVVESDQRSGLTPMMVVATAGTTDTGSIDPIGSCAEIASSAGAWLHVDAAYGGFFQLTGRGRDRLRGLELADSITVDAHKSLFLPFGIGGLLVRDPVALVEAHEGSGAYMQDIVEGALPHFTTMGPELTRPNRGLPVWLALHLHGVAEFRAALDRMLDLAEFAHAELSAMEDVEVLSRPDLSIVGFSARSGDEATASIFDALIASGEVHVSRTTIAGRMVIRLAFLSQRTTRETAARVVELVRASLPGA